MGVKNDLSRNSFMQEYIPREYTNNCKSCLSMIKLGLPTKHAAKLRSAADLSLLYKLLSKTIQKKKEIEEDCLALTCYLILFYFLRFLCESLRTAVALETYLDF